MAFKVGNETVIQDIDASAAIVTNSNLDKLQINTTDVLVHDGVTITLKNVELDISVESTINTDNITEGTTNKFYSTSLFDTDFATKTTSDLAEGTNLYYTDARAVTALIPTTSALLPLAGGTMTGALILNGAPTTALQAATKAYVDSAVSGGTSGLDTDDISEGTTNLYYTDARVGTYLSNNNFATEAYVDTAEADAISTASADATTKADQAEVDAIATANAYTDTRETAITTAYESYADAGDTTTYNASKSYTDTEIATVLPLSGGTLTGPLTLSGLPTNNLHAATKSYVDSAVSSGTGALDTDDIPEGTTNLYYTTARANTDFDTRLTTKSTSDLAEGTNLYYTTARANTDFDTRLATKSTDNLSEGSTNLYYTDARVDARLSGGSLGSLTTTGNIDVGGNIQVDGDLTVLGTTTTVLSESTRINENLLYLNEGGDATITNAVGNGSTVTYTADNSYSTGYTVDITGVNPSSFNVTDATVTASDGTSFTISSTVTDTYVSGGTAEGHAHVNVDLGWAGAYDDGTYQHAGLFRDATDGLFKVFDSYTPEPSASPDINTGHASFSLADFKAENVHLNSAPTLSNHATTKAYVDSAVSSGTGALDTDDIPEGTINFYYTNARFDAGFSGKTTTNLTEGTNLYYTSARANTDFDTRLATKDTGDLAEGTNLYYTTARANTDFDTRLATKSTTNLTEGTNLYYTNARADARIVAAGSANWNTAYGWGDHSTQGYLTSATNNYVNSLSFNTSDGVLTAGRSGLGNLTVDIDGRYALSSSFSTTSDVQFDSLGIGTPASGVTGEIRATNDITAFYSSDINLKENIVNIENALDKVKQIRGVEFDWTQEYIDTRGGEDDYFLRKRDTGVIAQEVEEVLPEVVATRPDGTKAVKYDRMVGLLIEAIKEQQQQIENLTKEVEFLKGKR